MKADISERPGVGRLVWRQFRYQTKLFWRTPINAFFTLVFPLMLLFLTIAIFGSDEIEGLGMTGAQFLAPGLAVFAGVSNAYIGLAIATAKARDSGLLKRVKGTPLPLWAYIAGRLTATVYQAAVAVVVMIGVGIVLFGVEVSLRALPVAALIFIVGVGCFAALGMLAAAVFPDDATPAVTNATLLPLAAISDIFFPLAEPPAWMASVSAVFPLRHFVVSFREALDPAGVGLAWPSLVVMLAWGLAGAFLAARSFRWEPRRG